MKAALLLEPQSILKFCIFYPKWYLNHIPDFIISYPSFYMLAAGLSVIKSHKPHCIKKSRINIISLLSCSCEGKFMFSISQINTCK